MRRTLSSPLRRVFLEFLLKSDRLNKYAEARVQQDLRALDRLPMAICYDESPSKASKGQCEAAAQKTDILSALGKPFLTQHNLIQVKTRFATPLHPMGGLFPGAAESDV